MFTHEMTESLDLLIVDADLRADVAADDAEKARARFAPVRTVMQHEGLANDWREVAERLRGVKRHIAHLIDLT